ncbi:MAG: HipA domain-containing protein [gamma proteobacterium symbiont of Bathyaustriella thionipta]|nr:HipA domain-containing protein [gamma proteobacterium symbiont of Bathyaustriella thionipta]
MWQSRRFRRRHRPVSTTREEYPKLANAAMEGEAGGSSAGGEHPKFTAYSHERSAHVIVKFSPRGDNDVTRRWRDILITEYHASHVLNEHGLSAAETDLFEEDGRLFLESIRFDRSGEFGRSSMISLQSIDAEFLGSGGSWPQVIDGLFKLGLLGHFHHFDAKVLWLFGQLINNTDMHLGNLSMGIDGGVFRLLPAYDMCSMGFAPKSTGEVTPFTFVVPETNVEGLDEDKVSLAKNAARDFWKRVESDKRISREFSEFLVNKII